MNKRQRRTGACLILGGAMLCVLIRTRRLCQPYKEQEIAFSLEESFYSEDQELQLSTLLDSDIYFTMDGSLPDKNAQLYREPVKLTAGKEPKAVTIRAAAYYGEGAASEIYTKTYFLGNEIEERFSTKIVSITGEPESFYGYDQGILVPGRIRDEYVFENPGVEFTDTAPANYNLRGMESERPVHVEIWEADGTEIVSQDMGVRVYGGTSRGNDMKSLRLIARKDYGEGRISYEIFPESVSDWTGKTIAEYKRLVLRNHGNDHEKAYLRNELGHRLAKDAGFLDTQEFCGASVWLNGEYYGFEWLEENYDQVYFETHYGTKSGEGSWQILSPHRGNANTDLEDEAEAQAAWDFNLMYAYRYQDLRDDLVFAKLEEQLDVDNFLKYCAIEIYLSNPDWPDNNCKAYRWHGAGNHYNGPYLDGRWRFLLYDLDVGMERTGSSRADNPSLGEVLGEEESSWNREEPLLRAILQREDMRKRFTEIMEELMEGAFSYEHACRVIEGMQREMERELEFQMRLVSQQNAEEFLDAEEAYQHQKMVYEEEIEKIKEFFRLRPEVMEKELMRLSSPSRG
ncbi:hypothetical protein IMSAGC007_03898 [Lachnospiraceae bacterium]|nr:hypothetical protein IMSAGC007_03898 [Lachnospiraceae bacterium]